MRLAIDEDLDKLITCQGGFSTTLSYSDRQKLRTIVKTVHLAHFPSEFISDYQADKMIDVFGPETAAYLIRRTLEGG